MRKTLILALIMGFSAFNVQAETLKEGALYCVSAKKINTYYDYMERKEDKFAKKLMDNADCFIKKRNEEVILRSENKNNVELELFSGFTVWTKKENIIR